MGTLLLTVTGLLVLHFILASISRRCQYKASVFKKVLAAWGDNTDLMVTLKHYDKDDQNRPYAHLILIDIFGCCFGFAYGQDFKDGYTHNTSYGFHSSHGELLWNELWWKEDYYQMPWDTTEVFLQEHYLDYTQKCRIKDAIPFKSMTNTYYYTKSGSVQSVDTADFYILERVWTSRLAKLLGLSSSFNTRKVSIVCQTNEPLGSSGQNTVFIKIYTETIEAYDNYVLNQTAENLDNLIRLIEERIGYFMMIDKNY